MSDTLNGREMQQRLEYAGIHAQKVVRKRESGYYTADFYEPNMQSSIPPAQVFARQIQQRFPGKVAIIQTRDTRADWRPGSPVILASVTFDILM
jgi:hypothetical protein